MQADAPLAPGAVIGILGGGQLGRMLAMAAARLGFRAHIYCPDTDNPAADVAAEVTCAAYDDSDALQRFAARVDVVSFEFENVPLVAVEALAKKLRVLPPARAFAIGQDRVAEKSFALQAGLETARFAAIDGKDDLDRAMAEIGVPALLKTRRLGYDGKGQALIGTLPEAHAAWTTLGGRPAILEERIRFTREISLVLARGADGAIAAYDPPWNIHAGGILSRSIVPSGLDDATCARAKDLATRFAQALSYVGVLAVEFFVVPQEKGPPRLLFNEFAPRVHNSGHWTLDAAITSQFEQHIRAITGWPLGAASRHSDAVMENIIGKEADNWRKLSAELYAALHLYGKTEARKGRKMGHLTRLYPLGKRPADETFL